MKISEALKITEIDIRVDCGDRWLIHDEFKDEWIVFERKKRQKVSRIIITTQDEELAVTKLIEKS